MNIFLKINKKILLLILSLLSLFFLLTIAINKLNQDQVEDINILSDPKFDIINPNFTINSKKERISVKANKGNFIDSDLILLEKNVSFESDRFRIYSEYY